MSRSQQGSVFSQTQGQSNQAFGAAQNAFGNEQQDIVNYQAGLGQFAAANPYKPGGEYQSAQNMVLANTSDAAAQSYGAALQRQAARTGQNPAGSIAATEAMQQENERNLSGQQAAANEQRISGEAGYNQDVLKGLGAVPGMENQLGEGEGRLYTGALDAEEKAAQTPSFLDTLGSSFASGLGSSLGKAGAYAAG